MVVVSGTRVPEASDLWQLTMEHSPVGMAIVSPAGEFVTVNVALCDMLGHDPEVMARLSFQDITHPDDLATDVRLVEQALAGEIDSYRITKRYVRADGRILVGDLSVALLRDAHGVPIHFISQIVDLTERQAFAERLDAAEATAEAERRTSHAVFEGVSVGVLRLDADGVFVALNDPLRELLDLTFPEGHAGRAGQTGLAWDPDQRRLLTAEEMPSARAARGEEFDDLRIWVGDDAASRRALSVSARTVLDRCGLAGGAVLVYHDVTDMVRAMQVKDEFVSTVSHELRTPLTAALAYLELLDDTLGVNAESHQQVGAVRRNMLRLSHLVADLLFVTRAASGGSVVDPYDVDLATILAEAVESASLAADGGGVRLQCDAPPTMPWRADGMRVRQVLDNLLANAIAYGPRDSTVQVSLSATASRVDLVVCDEGPGIAAEEVGAVFERFYRGQSAHALRVPGTGLGLTTVRTIVEAHGGEVDLVSAPGQGTTVRVTLPR